MFHSTEKLNYFTWEEIRIIFYGLYCEAFLGTWNHLVNPFFKGERDGAEFPRDFLLFHQLPGANCVDSSLLASSEFWEFRVSPPQLPRLIEVGTAWMSPACTSSSEPSPGGPLLCHHQSTSQNTHQNLSDFVSSSGVEVPTNTRGASVWEPDPIRHCTFVFQPAVPTLSQSKQLKHWWRAMEPSHLSLAQSNWNNSCPRR